MSDENDFKYQILDGINFKECIKSGNPIRTAVDQLRGQNNAVGIILDKASQMTGSQQETVQITLDHYEQMLATVREGIQRLFDDPDAMKEAGERIKSGNTRPEKKRE